jgi:hypothetical protein
MCNAMRWNAKKILHSLLRFVLNQICLTIEFSRILSYGFFKKITAFS